MVHFEATYDRYRPLVIDRWREDGSPGSGLWFDLAPHLVEQALHPFGAPRAVTAEMAALRYGGRADAWALVTLRYPDKRVVLHVSLLAIGAAPRFRIHGTEGSLIKQAIDPQEAQIVAGLRPGDAGYGLDPDPLGDNRQRRQPQRKPGAARLPAGVLWQHRRCLYPWQSRAGHGR